MPPATEKPLNTAAAKRLFSSLFFFHALKHINVASDVWRGFEFSGSWQIRIVGVADG